VRDLVSLGRHRPRFMIVMASEGISMTGDAAFEIALAWSVIGSTGSIAALATILLFRSVPRGVLLLVGGSVVDRFSSRSVMMATHAVRAIAMLAAAVLTSQGAVPMWQLCSLAVVMGAAAAFFTPASESIVPALVEEGELSQANAVQGFSEQASSIVGPVLGGALVASAGASAVFAVNGVTFLVAALTLLAAARVARGRSESPRARQIGREILEGLAHARRSREVRLVLAVISAATLSYAGVFAVGLPALAQSWGDATSLGLIIAGWGSGQLVGVTAAAVTGLPRRWGLLLIGMTLLEALMFASLGFMPGPWAAAALLFFVGIGVAYSSDVALPTFIQTQTPRHLLGRTSAILGLPQVILEPVSIALLGVALSRSLELGFAVAAIPVLLVGALLGSDPRARALSATTVRHPAR
jgi:predicted MFS family arabinose efflux permease